MIVIKRLDAEFLGRMYAMMEGLDDFDAVRRYVTRTLSESFDVRELSISYATSKRVDLGEGAGPLTEETLRLLFDVGFPMLCRDRPPLLYAGEIRERRVLPVDEGYVFCPGYGPDVVREVLAYDFHRETGKLMDVDALFLIGLSHYLFARAHSPHRRMP